MSRAAGLAAILAGLAAAPPAAGQVRVESRIEPARITLGETAELVIEVTGSGVRAEIGEPVLPDLGPVEIVGRNHAWGVRMTGVQVSRHATFRYVLRPTAPGTLRLDPARVEVNGEAYSTPVRRLLVVDPGGGPPFVGRRPDEAVAEGGSPAVFASTRVDRATAWLGEQVTLTFTFYHDPTMPLSESPDYDPPDTPGFWRVELDDAPQVGVERIGGRDYHVQRFRYALFALRTGALEIGPAAVRVVEPDPDRWWAPGRPRTIRTDPLTVVARPLPSPTPVGFDGAVGRYRLSGGLTDRRASVGAPFELTLTVQGTGNPAAVPPPVLPGWPDVTVRPPAVETATTTRGGTVQGEKTFRWLLVPRAEGPLDLGVVRLPYFDPAAGGFATETLRLGEMRVAPGLAAAGSPATPETGPTLWPARSPRPPRLDGLAREPWYWAALAGPWLAWLGLLAGRRTRSVPRARPVAAARSRLERCAADLAAGAPGATARAATEIGHALEAIWGVRLAGVAPVELRPRLDRGGVPDAVAAAALEARTGVSEAEYGGRSAADAAAAVGRLAASLGPVRRAGTGPRRSRLLLLLAALGAFVPAPAAADPAADRAAWEAANRAYRAGDFAAAAAGYGALLAATEDPRLRADRAAALWRAGERGSAVAEYLRALRSAPREAGVRADLARLRGELGDPPAGSAPPGPLAWVRLDEILAALLVVSALAAGAVAATRGRRAVVGGSLAAIAAIALLAAIRAATEPADLAVAAAPAAIAGRPGGPPMAELAEGAVVDVLERARNGWRVRVDGRPAGWVAPEILVPLD